MVHTAIQLYSLRGLSDSPAALVERVGQTPFDGVEFAGFGDDIDALAAALGETGLGVPAAHVPIESLEADVDEVVSTADAIGCETVVVPYLDDSRFEDADAVDATAARLQGLADALADRGVRCCYHNHDQEFTRLADGTTAFERLIDRTDDRLGIELDLGWALAGGVDPVEFLERHADRTPLVHLKDVAVDARTPVDLGAGDLDLSACVETAERVGVEWVIYEHDEPADPAAMLAEAGPQCASLLSEST
ncbi:sugar phosphate isomerase/epimerase family protein [Haloferacaceae archaeon DSL9]